MIRILYVDDEEALLDVCKQFLERSGEISVDITTAAKDALLMMVTGSYDAVISDYQMPDINGIDFLKLIRSAGDPIPFVLFTGRGREEVVIEALNSGADFYLQKGGDPRSQFKELEHKVKEAVRRNRAEKALKLKEDRLNRAHAIGMTGCWEFNLEVPSDLLWGSEESFRLFGVPYSDEGNIEIARIEECIVEREHAHQALKDLIEKGTEYNLEYHVIPADDGPTRALRSMAELVRDPTGRPTKIVGVVQDITERKKAEAGLRRLNRELMAIKECNKAMVRARTEMELVQDICNIVCDVAGYQIAWIGMAENDEAKTVRPVAWSGNDKGYIAKATVTWGDDESGCGAMGTAIKTARTVVIQDLQEDPAMRPWRESFIELGYRSMIALPIFDSGAVFGAFGIYIEDAEGFRPEEIDLLEEMTGDLAFGILGLRAKERRIEAEDALRMSEERFRTLFLEAPVAVSISMGDRIHQCNPRFMELFGLEGHGQIEDLDLRSLISSNERERLQSLIEKRSSGEPLDILTVGKKLDGGEFSLHAMFTNVMISEKPALLGFFIDASERERMQSRIAESEEKYRTFIEKAPLAFALTSPSNAIIEVNRAFCDLLDCDLESMIGMNPMDLMPFEDQEVLRTKLPILQLRGAESMNCRLRKGDGTYVPVHVFSTVLPNGNTIAFIEDVTERMAYEERLRANEERLRSSELNFRTIFDRAALGIVTTDMKGRPIDFNDRFVEMIGYGPDEIRQKSFSDITHPDDVARNQELFQAIQAGTIDSYELEKRYIHKDGKSVWVHLFTSKLEGAHGQLEKVLTIIEDITERKRIEDSLRNSEEKYSRLVAAIPDFVIRTDMKGNIVIVNDVALSHSGYRLEDVKGHSLFSFIAAEDVGKALKNAELMVGGKLGPVEYHLIMKDGRRILFEANGDVMREPSGIPTGLVFVCRDMTERRQLESKLRGANRRLRVMDKVTRHDTVNKLMSLQGYVDLQREGKSDIKDLNRLDRMDQIVSFLRDQANVTEDYHNIGVDNPEWQSVKDICLRASSLVNLGEISLNVDVGDLEIMADPLLYKVFYNLMDNSVRHGKRADCISVKAERFEDTIKITLSDNGVGISPYDKANLFKEGYGKVHGLGLFLSREILDITGMTIIETGEPGKGVRFEISVPESSFRWNDRPPQPLGQS